MWYLFLGVFWDGEFISELILAIWLHSGPQIQDGRHRFLHYGEFSSKSIHKECNIYIYTYVLYEYTYSTLS